MGLNTSYHCWDGAYSSFARFRKKLAEAAGMPPLQDMYGFGGNISWDDIPYDDIHILLNHSDCDGDIGVGKTIPLRNRLKELLNVISVEERCNVIRFIEGLDKAIADNKGIEFY